MGAFRRARSCVCWVVGCLNEQGQNPVTANSCSTFAPRTFLVEFGGNWTQDTIRTFKKVSVGTT